MAWSTVADRLERFPAYAGAHRRVLGLLQGAPTASHELAAAITADFAILAAVLRVASGRGRPVATASQALDAVPAGVVEEAIAPLPAVDRPTAAASARLAPGPFVAHAVAVKDAVERIERASGREPREERAVIAVLHDVGKLALAARHPDYDPDPRRSAERRTAEERRAYGLDHAEAGAEVLACWQLPDGLVDAVRGHHRAGGDEDRCVVRLADMLVNHQAGYAIELEALSQAAVELDLSRDQLGALLYEAAAPVEPVPDEGCPLTSRETQVLRLIAGGKSNKQVAAELGISAETVRVHTHNVYSKLDVFDRAQAVLEATRHGWL